MNSYEKLMQGKLLRNCILMLALAMSKHSIISPYTIKRRKVVVLIMLIG